MLRKVCLLRNLSRISSFVRTDLIPKQACNAFCTSLDYKNTERSFIAKFVPDYSPSNKSFIRGDLVKFENDYSEKEPGDLVFIFENMSYYCESMDESISDEKYTPIVQALCKKLPEMTDEEVKRTLINFTRIPRPKSIRDPNFEDLYTQLDKECWHRCSHWRTQELLKVMHSFYRLGLSKITKFNHKAILKITTRIMKVDARLLVEIMFYQSIIRHKDVAMYNVEARFMEVFDELNLVEVGIICLAFFKRESKILNTELLDKIYNKFINEIDDAEDITIVNFMKILRYSSKPSNADAMNKVSELLYDKIDSLNNVACMHIAQLGVNLLSCNTKTLEKIIRKMNDGIEKVRLKELDRMSLVIALFDLKTESGIEMEFLKNVRDQLKVRVQEIVNHPRCFTSTVHYLTMKGIYDLELIEAALKEKFLLLAYGKNHAVYSREILCLDSLTKINLKGVYKGTALSDKIRQRIANYQTHFIPRRDQKQTLTAADRISLDVKDLAESKFGPSFLAHILPHYERPDMVYCFDENGKSITPQIQKAFGDPNHYSGTIYSKDLIFERVPELAERKDKLKLVAVVVGSWNLFLRNSETPVGSLRMKLEQLKMIGFETVVAPYTDWTLSNRYFKEENLINSMNQVIQKTAV